MPVPSFGRRALGGVSVVIALGAASAVSADLASTISSSRGVQVAEDQDTPAVTGVQRTAPRAGELDGPFDVDEIRRFLLTADLPLGSDDVEDVRSTLRSCARCLEVTGVSQGTGEVYQLVTVSTAGDGVPFVAVAVGASQDGPDVALAAAGSGISFASGRHGSVVAEEAYYAPEDAVCCPRGSTLQVYRLVDGRFEAGERYVQRVGLGG